MSLRAQIKKEGEYPPAIGTRETLKIANQTIVLTTYETEYGINIYLGGAKHWCIHCELIKDKDTNRLKREGYLIKIRYDMLCSIEENIKRGGDMSKLLNLLIQYINDTYPDVKHLLFNDLSTRRCDNGYTNNLAVMTYLYSEKTWYEKNFGASIAASSRQALEDIITRFSASKIKPWEIIKNTIYNYKELPLDVEQLYSASKTWKEFFEEIIKTINIQQFCIFISPWLDSFIIKYFNNLMGLTYQLPIQQTNLTYTKNKYAGGRYKSFFKGARKNRTIKRFSEME